MEKRTVPWHAPSIMSWRLPAGKEKLLDMYIFKSEGVNFWLGVLTDFLNRRVQEIFIACMDGLNGFPDAIASVFPQTTVQLCIVTRYVTRSSMWPARTRRSLCLIWNLYIRLLIRMLPKRHLTILKSSGWGLSDCHQELAWQLGLSDRLLPVLLVHQKNNIHHQYRGRLSLSAS